jgi:hypothetical protein
MHGHRNKGRIKEYVKIVQLKNSNKKRFGIYTLGGLVEATENARLKMGREEGGRRQS